ncbi:hypothetical protein [Archangium sp.]|uniref:hypothetical protein n=1 Tax=Archangium sp. TaxID=1872627 RepID=UPI00389B3290
MNALPSFDLEETQCPSFTREHCSSFEKKSNARNALEELNVRLRDALGNPEEFSWTFPDGNKDALPTWHRRMKGEYLTIGFKPDFRWSSQSNASKRRCPVLISLEKAHDGMSLLVEVNIPRKADRRVNGCFSLDEDHQLWLCHRGTKLTVNQTDKITKEKIHRHFRKKIVPAADGDACVRIIPLFPLNSKRIRFELLEFAQEVAKLKGMR